MKLIVGLGNPETRYDSTRHNIGFRTLDRFLQQCPKVRAERRHSAVCGFLKRKGEDYCFAKPLTFMNRSGRAVAALAHDLGVGPEDTVILHDDADLEEGRIQIKRGGGTGGHRGLESIVYEWEKDDFYRLRIGIGRPPEGMELTDFVLAPASKKLLDDLATKAAEALEQIVSLGPYKAMNVVNVRA